jgi:hypothetical protein
MTEANTDQRDELLRLVGMYEGLLLHIGVSTADLEHDEASITAAILAHYRTEYGYAVHRAVQDVRDYRNMLKVLDDAKRQHERNGLRPMKQSRSPGPMDMEANE